MTVAAIPAAEAAATGEGAAVAGRGAGQVVDAKVISSKPLRGRNTRVRDHATSGGSAGLGSALGNGLSGRRRGSKSSTGRASNARRLLVAEFVLCMVVLAFSPLTGKSPSAPAFMKRGSAIIGLFFLLGLTSTAGRGASRAAAGFGGLVTLVLLISDRSIFTKLAGKMAPGIGEDTGDLGGLDAQDAADAIGNAVGDALDGLGGDTVGGVTPLLPEGSGAIPGSGPLGNGIR